MKILYVITKANWGGAQKYVYDVALAAQAAGHDVAVAVGGTGPLTDALQKTHIRTISLPLRQKRTFFADVFSFGTLFPLIQLFREEQPDVIHANSAKAGGLAVLAGRIAHVPRIIFTAHGWEFNASRSFLAKLGIRFFSWLTLLLAHETLCVSDAVRRDVHYFPFVQRKLRVIHLGIACLPQRSREEARALLSPRTVAPYWICMISELHKTKCIPDALDAFALLSKKHPEALLVIMGEGDERHAIETRMRELDIRDRVHLAGFEPDAASLLGACDLFLHTARSEALGYAILEAGCASLPVVATRVGGIPEIIIDDEHGRLVPQGDARALARAMSELIVHPRRAAEIGARLRARVATAFSKEKMLSATLARY